MVRNVKERRKLQWREGKVLFPSFPHPVDMGVGSTLSSFLVSSPYRRRLSLFCSLTNLPCNAVSPSTVQPPFCIRTCSIYRGISSLQDRTPAIFFFFVGERGVDLVSCCRMLVRAVHGRSFEDRMLCGRQTTRPNVDSESLCYRSWTQEFGVYLVNKVPTPVCLDSPPALALNALPEAVREASLSRLLAPMFHCSENRFLCPRRDTSRAEWKGATLFQDAKGAISALLQEPSGRPKCAISGCQGAISMSFQVGQCHAISRAFRED